MTTERPHVHVSRRERQILDVLYERGEATAAVVRDALPDSPSYSTVRALLRKLLEKGHVTFRQDGPRYVYRPSLPRANAVRGAMERLVDVFFRGSPKDAVVGLLGRQGRALSDDDLDAIEQAVRELRRSKR